MATDAERKAAAKAAFDKRQARIRKDKGVTVAQRNTQKENTIARAKILAQLGLSVLPAGAVIRGGMLIYKGLKGAKALAALRKAEQARKASKASTPSKAASKPSTPPRAPGLATNRKPVSLPKKTTPAKAPPRAPGLATNRKPVSLPKKTPKKGLTAAQKLAIAGGVAATAGATKLSNTNAKPTATATKAAKRKPTGMADRKTNKPAAAKRKPTGMGDRKTSKPTVEASKRKPTGMGDRKARKPVEKKRTTRTDKEIAAKMLTRKEREERPSPRSFSPDKAKEGAATKRTNISASKNTGFGPKGNIFPSNAADRKRLMAKYGGTGSAAAKAAARGTQGNLKKRKK